MFKNLNIKRKIIIWSASVFCGIACFVDTASASISVSRAFYELARQNNTQKIESLLYRGYSLESVDENGYNPVCIAVSRQDRVSYNVLTSYGANKKPSCLKLVPESSYRRFFGSNPVQKEIIKDESDTPYWMGVALLGGGATALAFALKGGSGGGSGGGSSEEYEEIDGCEPGWQNKDKCTLCKNNYTLSKDGKKCILSIKCPSNSEYNSSTEKCECKKGYGNFGNEEKCYKKMEGCLSQREDKCEKCDENYIHYNDMCYKRVENCKTYEEGKCSDCNEGYILDGNKCIVDCPENSTYNISKKACICDSGYGKYGQTGDDKCYKSIENCANGEQKNEICNKCKSGYILSDNQCYKKIDNCEIQNADKCIQCESGYDVHGGDGTICYKNLENCVNQNQDKCIVCESGYGVHGDPNGKCYQDVEKCIKYVSNNYTQCQDCELGYIASNGTCWEDINCDKTKGLTQKNNECVCDERRGYTGTPDNCTRAEGEYVEGEGHYDVWSDLNMLYCNSHGIYNTASASCSCNEGYTGVSCSDCDEGFINFDGLCYKEIQCDKEDHRIQYYTSCVCDTGYIEIDNKCIKEKQCGKGMQQGKTGECECKPNFVQQDDGTCECPTEEVDGVEYEYDATLDICAPKPKSCDEKNKNGDKWAGENCDECPINYQITINEETGIEECRECADNYQKDEKGECTQCAEGYMKDAFTDMCVYKECEDGKDGYIIIDGTCVCDESKGYYLGPSGRCQPKKRKSCWKNK